MKKTFVSVLGVTFLTAAFGSAHALNITVTNDTTSQVAGESTIDFGVSPINNSGPVAGSAATGSVLYTGTAGGVQYTYTDGALFNFDSTSGLPGGTSARPVGSTGNFWSIGSSPAEQVGDGVITFSKGLSYFGFLWGSPDSYNQLSFYSGSTLLGSTLDGSLIMPTPNGDQSFSRYVNVFAGPGEAITSIVFSSGTNAFETDNHALIAAVPEPSTYMMMLSGMCLLGFMTRRRKSLLA